MIKLTKGQKPSVLQKNEESWRNDYLAALASSEPVPQTTRFRYRNREIKEAIRLESHDKCAYCESKISHIYPGQTDHIRPVSKNPAMIVDWDNLTYVCEECNRKKSNYDEPAEPLVHPYRDVPPSHIVFLGPLAWHPSGDDKGYRTVRIIDLNRPALVERRTERMRQLQPLLDRWAQMAPGPTKDIVEKEIREHGGDDMEYASLVRTFLRQTQGW